jgi:hypothetical protein
MRSNFVSSGKRWPMTLTTNGSVNRDSVDATSVESPASTATLPAPSRRLGHQTTTAGDNAGDAMEASTRRLFAAALGCRGRGAGTPEPPICSEPGCLDPSPDRGVRGRSGAACLGLASPTQGGQTAVNGANRDAPTAHLRGAQLPPTRAADALASRGWLPAAVTRPWFPAATLVAGQTWVSD